jgi:hypothetical protein
MSTKKGEFKNVEDYFKRLDELSKSIDKGYDPRDKYELLSECNKLISDFEKYLEKYYKKIESDYQKRLETMYKNLSEDTGGTFNPTNDLSNIPSGKKKSYKADIDISSNQRNFLDD